MSREGLLDYRKLALASYDHRCVYCGFGVKEVLEVAHLDCDPNNCDISNPALICPTCHRMHDIDLIPTEVIIRLRDEKRKSDWSKLTKDAGVMAVETKRLILGKLAEAGRKATATRKTRQVGK